MSIMRNTENIFQEVKTYLNSNHMRAYESWISGCVDFFNTSGTTLEDIKEQAYQQWILNDLSLVCPGSLPRDLAKLDKTVLHGEFVLQINTALDISISVYQQYLKMTKSDTENEKATMDTEEKISSKRMLKFQLTDGIQTIVGLEYETISKVKKTEDITPGSKILIKGPVQCRQGTLLLTNTNVKFLGGEVQSLIEKHSLAAQLAAKREMLAIESGPPEHETIRTINGGISYATSTATLQNRHQQNLVPSHRNVTRSPPTTSGNENSAVVDSYSFGKRQLETETAPGKKIKLSEVTVVEDDDSEKFDEEVWRAIEECERLHSSSTSQSVHTEPFVYIKQINELAPSEKLGKVYRVKAQIQNVLTKLSMTANREWNLKCTLIDGTGSLDVEFASDILSKFLGYTPENISELKKTVAINPGIKDDINLAYIKTAETLRTLYCIMELTMYSLPKITRLIEFDDTHVELLKKRVNNLDGHSN